jgi:predicted dehydrogenase
MDAAIDPASGSDVEQVFRLTDGLGADGVIIAAATPSDVVVSTAFQMCRRKGRVVLVGDVGLNLKRADFYSKEIDFLISTSYGPGRYDTSYEELGLDYPPAYVRWTENRNMAEYLRLIAAGRVQVKPLIAMSYPITEAAAAYESLKSGVPRPLIVLLGYPPRDEEQMQRRVNVSVAHVAKARVARCERVRIAVVGTGSFAKGTHLPNIRRFPTSYHLQAIVSRAGHNALATAREFGATYATTEYEEVLGDTAVDAVLLATRHHMHAKMTLQALDAGKHVLVEKPLCLTSRELDQINSFFASAPQPQPVLLTGFNRRFSPPLRRLRELTAERSNPMILNYRMNAGRLPPDHWVFSAEGGGRNLGEACHIYDLFTFLTDSAVQRIQTAAIRPHGACYQSRDNFVVALTFADGSVGNLVYTAMGSTEYPKENLEVFVDGKVIVLEDYRSMTVIGSKAKGWNSKLSQKGHVEELEAFARAVRGESDWPIPIWQQIQATQIALGVEHHLCESLAGLATVQAAPKNTASSAA